MGSNYDPPVTGAAGPGFAQTIDDALLSIDKAMVVAVLSKKIGGVGDGVALEDAATAAALAALTAAGGGTIYYGPGLFLHAAHAAAVGLPQILVLGAGKRATAWQLKAGIDDGCWLVRNTSEAEFRGIHWIGNGTSASDGLSGSAIFFDNSGASGTTQGFRVFDCEFEGFKGAAWVRVQDVVGLTIRDIHIERNRFHGGGDQDPTNGGVAAAHITLRVSTSTGIIRDFWICDNVHDAGPVKQAIELSDLSNHTGGQITRGEVERNHINDPGSDHTGTAVNTEAISVYGAGCSRIVVARNEIEDAWGTGIYVVGGYRIRVVGNAINHQTDTINTTLLRGAIVLALTIKAIAADNDINDAVWAFEVQPNNTSAWTADIHDNDISNCGTGVLVRPNPDGTSRGVTIHNNQMEGITVLGVDLWFGSSDGTKRIFNVQVTFNTINCAGGIGIGHSAVCYFTNLRIEGNDVNTTGTHGYKILAGNVGDIVGVTYMNNKSTGGTTAGHFLQYLVGNFEFNKSDSAGTASNSLTGAFALPGCQGQLRGNTDSNLASGASRCIPLGDNSGIPDLGRQIPAFTAEVGTIVENWSPANAGKLGWVRTTAPAWKPFAAIDA